MGINRIASRHYEEMDRADLRFHTARFDYTEPNPEAPGQTNLGLARSIVIRHIAEGHYRADETQAFLDYDMIRALITVDLSKAPNAEHLNELIDTFPETGEFDSEKAKDDYQDAVNDLLRGIGFQGRA